ncbi:MAG: hypothetical protein M3360_01550 [Actinomycetota bacterium]|nr:hypothetical protein [Actinomycetota bacterium]
MTKSLRRGLVLALAPIVLVALCMPPAPAISSTGHKDAQGKLNIVFVKASSSRDGIGRFELGTEKRVRCRYLRTTKVRSLKWLFDDGRDGGFDLKGKFVCTKGHLFFHMRGTRTQNRYEPIRPKRPGRRSLVVRFPLDLAELRAKHLWAAAKSRDGQSPGCTKPCRDRAPDSGFLNVY